MKGVAKQVTKTENHPRPSLTGRLAHFTIRHRLPFLICILLLTVFFGYEASRVKIESPTIDLFPKGHPYVETFKQYQDIFGGANTMAIGIVVREGDIFNYQTLEKIHRITKAVELLPAINNYQVLSIAQRKVKKIEVDEVIGFRAEPVMWPDVPRDPEAIAKLRRAAFSAGGVPGTLVSWDGQAALILAGFFEKDFDPRGIYTRLQEIIGPERDANTSIHLIGRPVLLGSIMDQYPKLAWIFLVTLVSIVGILFLYFRDVRGVMIPVSTAVISAIWGFGFLGICGYNFDPLIVVVPFIISARALSHSVQLTERYTEDFARLGHRLEAAEATFSGLFKPGMLSIITDAAGVFVVYLTPIPLMQKLALMGSFWVMSIVVSDIFFNPILLSYLPPPVQEIRMHHRLLEKWLNAIAGWCLGRTRWVIAGVTVGVFGIGLLLARNLVIGDVHPGTPMLWPGSSYNQDTVRIGEKFGNTEIMNVIVEGGTHNAIKLPEVLRNMEGLQRKLEAIPEVSATYSLADLLPQIIKTMHGGGPKWELIPTERQESGFFLEMIYSSAEPGDLNRFVTPDSKDANITVFLRDHKGDTLRRVIQTARDYIDSHPMESARFLLAGGLGGLLAAVNEVITKTQALVTFLAFLLIFVSCALAFRSVVAGLLFLVPIAISNYLTYAVMGALGIGLDVNVLPVVSLGVGLGVDYGIYIIGRIEEEIRGGADLNRAIQTSLVTAGKAVTFTASTMVVGIGFWGLSFLRFQAEMGLLLAFWMVTSMLSGLIILPTLITFLKPRFLSAK